MPRRPDVAIKLGEEQRILEFIAPRLSMAVPRWQVCSRELVAYRRLPGSPGLTLDAAGRPVWHFDPSSIEFAAALGRLIAELQAADTEAAAAAGVPYLEAGGVEHPHLAERCAELAAAAPLAYGLFALRCGDPQHRAAAAAQLLPSDG